MKAAARPASILISRDALVGIEAGGMHFAIPFHGAFLVLGKRAHSRYAEDGIQQDGGFPHHGTFRLLYDKKLIGRSHPAETAVIGYEVEWYAR
jgi:hypothetical protein